MTRLNVTTYIFNQEINKIEFFLISLTINTIVSLLFFKYFFFLFFLQFFIFFYKFF